MKEIKHVIKGKIGSQYRVYANPHSITNVDYYLKYRKKFLFIPYWVFVKTSYETIRNYPITFYSYKQIIDFIEKLELTP